MLNSETLVLRTRPSQVIAADAWVFAFIGSLAVWVVTLLLTRLALLGLSAAPAFPGSDLPFIGHAASRQVFDATVAFSQLIGYLVRSYPWVADLISNLWIVIPVSLTPFIGAIWKSLDIHCTVYELTTERLTLRSGIFSVHYDEIELFRVRDFEINQPLYLRLFGLGNLRLFTADRTNPIFDIVAQRHVRDLRDILRQRVMEHQQKRGYRESEVT